MSAKRSLDLSKLTPAPWEVYDAGPQHYEVVGDRHRDEEEDELVTVVAKVQIPANSGRIPLANAGFIALARNAFDVMMRRGWYAYRDEITWYVAFPGVDAEAFFGFRDFGPDGWTDPFTALVEADKWYKENVEK